MTLSHRATQRIQPTVLAQSTFSPDYGEPGVWPFERIACPARLRSKYGLLIGAESSGVAHGSRRLLITAIQKQRMRCTFSIRPKASAREQYMYIGRPSAVC